MKHRISRRAFLNGCTLLAAAAAVSSLTSCGEKEAKDSGLAQIVVGSDTYPPYIYLNNDGVPTGIDVEIATEAFRRMGYAARFETIDWEQKTNLVESGSDPRIPQTVEVLSIENRSVQYAMLACGYVDAIAAHEMAILQYMKDNDVEFRILEEPLLVTGLGVAFAKNDTRGLDSQLTDTLAQMRADGTLERIVGRYLENASQYLEVDTVGA